MGSAIQAGDSAISRCRNRELNTAEPDTAEAQESWLGPDPGTGREVYVPAPPASSVTRTLRPETRARREPAQTGAQAIPPARCRRVINVPLATAINGQLQSLRGQSSCLVSYVIAHDMSNSEAESAGSIPVTRSTVKSQVKSPS